jgi:hypothetical protein
MPAELYTVLLIAYLRQIVYRREIFHTWQLLLSEIKMSDLQINQSQAPVYDGPLLRRSIAGQGVVVVGGVQEPRLRLHCSH